MSASSKRLTLNAPRRMRTVRANGQVIPAWRLGLKPLEGRRVLLREPTQKDLDVLLDLLSAEDALRFHLDEPVSRASLRAFIDRVIHDRADGFSFTYTITAGTPRTPVGLIQVRQLDNSFDTAECECFIGATARGGGLFLESARLASSFAFDTVGARRIESRVPLRNRRANGALRKLGATQEAILRRSLRRGPALIDQALWSMLKDEWKPVLRPGGKGRRVTGTHG